MALSSSISLHKHIKYLFRVSILKIEASNLLTMQANANVIVQSNGCVQ